MKRKISIIVPVYNVEQYIDECLTSIEKQNYDDFEVVIVNDGSTDDSKLICEEYTLKHDNVVLVNQRNQGLSAARNAGVLASSGDYITFVDSDDIISNSYLNTLIETALKYDADITVGKSLKFWDKITQKPNKGAVELLTPEKALIEMCNGYKFGVSACCKLYRRELVEEFPYPVGKLFEDLDTTYKIIGSSKKIAYCDDYLYFYRQREQSISHNNGITEAQLYGLEAAKHQLEYVKQKYPNATTAAEARCVLKAFDYISSINDGSKESRIQYKQLQKYINDNTTNIIASRNVNVQNKLRYISIKCGYLAGIIMDKILEFIKKCRARRKN